MKRVYLKARYVHCIALHFENPTPKNVSFFLFKISIFIALHRIVCSGRRPHTLIFTCEEGTIRSIEVWNG